MSSKRLFLAIPLSRDWLSTFERYRDRHGDIPYLRWTPLVNLHVTALFLGDVEERTIPEVVNRAREVVDVAESFELPLERIQYAPPESRARMVWAYFGVEAPYVDLVLELARTMSEIDAGLDDLKGQLIRSGADITPHITLARFRSDRAYPKELRHLSRTEREGECLLAKELVLYESHLESKSPLYRVIERFPIKEDKEKRVYT